MKIGCKDVWDIGVARAKTYLQKLVGWRKGRMVEVGCKIGGVFMREKVGGRVRLAKSGYDG